MYIGLGSMNNPYMCVHVDKYISICIYVCKHYKYLNTYKMLCQFIRDQNAYKFCHSQKVLDSFIFGYHGVTVHECFSFFQFIVVPQFLNIHTVYFSSLGFSIGNLFPAACSRFRIFFLRQSQTMNETLKEFLISVAVFTMSRICHLTFCCRISLSGCIIHLFLHLITFKILIIL